MNLTDELNRRARYDALKRYVAKHLNKDEREHVNTIEKAFRQKLMAEKKRHREEYHTRMSQWRKKYIDEAGGIKRVLKPVWAGNDQFEKTAIEKKAHAQVEAFHYQNINTIRDWRNNKIDKLVRQSQRRQQLKQKPKEDFNQVTDRRQGRADRRRPNTPKPASTRRLITYST